MNPPILTPENYYEDTYYMSVSTYKRYLICEETALLNIPFEPTPSMLVGSYVDAYVEGTLESFIKDHPEIISSRGATKGELKSEFKLAELICRKIDTDKTFRQFMSGEKQVIMTGEIHGMPWKIKMDSYSPHIAINDLKIMASVTNKKGDWIDFITPWGYDIQLACYQEIVYQNTGERLPVFDCALTKEIPINSVIVNLPQTLLDMTYYGMKDEVERIRLLKKKEIKPNRCEKCDHCIETRTDTPIISFTDIMSNM